METMRTMGVLGLTGASVVQQHGKRMLRYVNSKRMPLHYISSLYMAISYIH